MADYVKVHEDWGYATECCADGPDAGQPDTKIRHVDLEHMEDGIFTAQQTADNAAAAAAGAQGTADAAVPASATPNLVYTNDASGDPQEVIVYSVNEDPFTIALRDAEGNLKSAAPADPDDVSTMAFTEEQDAASSLAPPGYDVILLAGQSNMAGFAGQAASATLDPAIDKVFMLKQDNTIVQASEFLDHPSTPTSVGPGLPFARHYIRAALNRGRKVLLVPTAVFATPLVSTTPPTWNATVAGSLRDLAVTRANTAIAAEDGSRIAAILWIQGGADATNNETQANYAAALDALIAYWRANIAGAVAVPFVLSADPPEFVGGTITQIRAALVDTPNRNTKTWYVQPPSNMSVAATHFTNPGSRIIGQRLRDGLLAVNTGHYMDSTASAATGLASIPDNMHQTGRFFVINSSASTNVIPTLNELRVYPWPVWRPLQLGALFVQVAVAGSGDSVVRLGVYGDDGTGLPSTLVQELGTVSGAAPGVFTLNVPMAIMLNTGLYWVAAVCQGTTAPTMVTVAGGALYNPQALFSGAAAFAPAFSGWRHTGVSGALPAAFVSAGVAINPVRVGYRVD